jgi:hypothetical protein
MTATMQVLAGTGLRGAPTMRTSYRDISLLACCQALLLANNAGLIAMNGLVGYSLVKDKALATTGVVP